MAMVMADVYRNMSYALWCRGLPGHRARAGHDTSNPSPEAVSKRPIMVLTWAFGVERAKGIEPS